MASFVVSSGGDYALRIEADGIPQALAQARELLTSPGPHHLFYEEEWADLCEMHHSDSADSDMVYVAVNARRAEAMKVGLLF